MHGLCADQWVHSRTRQPPDHDNHPKSEDQIYPGSSKGGGDLLPNGGSSAKTAPRCRPSLGGPIVKILAELIIIIKKKTKNNIISIRSVTLVSSSVIISRRDGKISRVVKDPCSKERIGG